MALEDLEKWTLRELEALANRLGVEGGGALSRRQLIAAIESYREAGDRGGLWHRVVSFARALAGSSPSSDVEAPDEDEAPNQEEAPGKSAAAPQADVASEPIRTLTMARLLAAQGHHARALVIFRELAAKDPNDESLARETAECERSAAKAPAGQEEERRVPSRAADEVVSAWVDEGSVLISWEVSEEGIARASKLLESQGALTARLIVVGPDPKEIVRTEVRERRVERMGEWLIAGLRSDARTTASIGVAADGAFVSIAHCPVSAPAGAAHRKG